MKGITKLDLEGEFYPRFIQDKSYSGEAKEAIKRTVQQLLEQPTSASRPGMLLGKIQSGKTKTFMGIIALAFDNNFDVTVVLTKGTKALAKQTLERITREFSDFVGDDLLQVFDILSVPPRLTRYELNQKIVFVVKKQVDNLNRLGEVIFKTYPELARKRMLLIDDEADYASIGFRKSKDEGPSINRIAGQIDELRKKLSGSAFLQVTATPYSLYLQPEDLKIEEKQQAFKPVRPAFTVLVPVHDGYIGGDYYFYESQEKGSIASYLHELVSQEELLTLKKEDRRKFKIEECLTSPKVKALRDAVVNFIVGGTIRRLQNQKEGKSRSKYSFIIHTEAGKPAHAWQERIVAHLKEDLERAVNDNQPLLDELIKASYENLAQSIRIAEHYLPSLKEVSTAVYESLREGQVMNTKVNSEQEIAQLLDDQGQLKLRTPLNIFIGGQILDRGITIANLIGFFYGRRPQKFQQDTVLQHSRMFGFRPLQDLTVTRFYTSPGIYEAMRKIQDSDSALRESIDKGDQEVIFIQKDDHGRVIPCSPNKILLSTTTTLRPFKRLLPIGFQTGYKTYIAPTIKEIDEMIEDLAEDQNMDEPFLIPLASAKHIIKKIEKTLEFEDEGYEWDVPAFQACMQHLSKSCSHPEWTGKVWCLVRKNRNISRYVTKGHGEFSTSPDTASTEGQVSRKVATDIPMLMLIKQNGLDSQGWRGTPFYWPVLVAPRNTRTAIFASDVLDEG